MLHGDGYWLGGLCKWLVFETLEVASENLVEFSVLDILWCIGVLLVFYRIEVVHGL